MTVLPTLETTDGSGVPPDAAEVPTRRAQGTRERVAAHALVADIARQHGEALLRTAGRFSACSDDAHDAYQRAMELLLEHASTIDRAKAVPWLHVVVRREASAIRRSHDRNVPLDGDDVEEATARLAGHADDQLHTIDLARRAGEALATLKETEAQALCLRAQGLSYDEIAEAYGWSYTKVNRAVTEGRRNFVAHYRAVESGLICTDTADLVARFAAGELKPRIALKVRAHLVRCTACRALLHAERQADASLRALLPTATVASAGSSSSWLHDHLLAPIGHFAGRLQPIADHVVASKVGLAAASTVALATSGIAVEHELRSEPAPALRSALTADRDRPSASGAAAAPATITLPAALSTAADRGTKIAATERRRVAAVKRRKAAAAKRAKAKSARAAANRREFGPAGGEFSGTSGSSGTTASRSGGSGSATTASAPTAPAAEVPVTDGSTDSSVDVAPESPSSSAPSSSSVSDEFGP